MSKRMLARFGLAVGLIALAYGGFNLVGAGADSKPQAQTVIVGNTTTNPVPVKGVGTQTVSIANTTTNPVPVKNVGTQTVIVANTQTVSLPNTTLPVHEQGTATVSIANTTVPVHEQGTANVNIANATVPVHEQGTANVNLTNTDLSVVPEAPISDGGGQAVAPADGAAHNIGSTVTASELSLYLPNEVTSLTLYDQGNVVATFEGPGTGYLVDLVNVGQAPVFTNSIMNIPLARPLTFDSVKCSGGSQQCMIGWVGNSP